ncbi:MAG: hypothetical protein M3Q06_00400 [Bacteroidota bacterium]|nr:hypothetical protein [Bacteroidota bacterium]
MKKAGVNHEILHLLVSVYNQSIQTYYYFPEVILCDRQRLDREQFEALLAADFLVAYKADSFGKYYRLSKKGEEYLLASSFRRRHKQLDPGLATRQPLFPFVDAGQLHC